MHKTREQLKLIPIYGLILLFVILLSFVGSKTVTAFREVQRIENRRCVIIDAGHGGVDGGATSCSGVLESDINLQIALRLNDLFHLLGIDTKMIRSVDRSIHTEGESIAAKKVSDLKERVRIVNSTDNAILISIHQNHYPDSQYKGGQVFYSNNKESKELAQLLQKEFVKTINKASRRQAKLAEKVYLMQHIQCPGVLIECGFISNFEEEAKLLSADYQKKLCTVIVSSVSTYFDVDPV